MRLRTAVPMMLLLLLCACGAAKTSAQTPIQVRTALQSAGGCGFTLDLTADYGDYTRAFSLDCRSTAGGETSLTVLAPTLAQGITASVRGEDAQVSYDGTVLAVEAFASRPISPMAAPHILASAWTEGYIDAVGTNGELEEVRYLLGYGGRQLEVITRFAEQTPVQAEISDGTNTLIACEIRDFIIKKRTDDDAEHTETDLGGDQPGSSPAQRGSSPGGTA